MGRKYNQKSSINGIGEHLSPISANNKYKKVHQTVHFSMLIISKNKIFFEIEFIEVKQYNMIIKMSKEDL